MPRLKWRGKDRPALLRRPIPLPVVAITSRDWLNISFQESEYSFSRILLCVWIGAMVELWDRVSSLSGSFSILWRPWELANFLTTFVVPVTIPLAICTGKLKVSYVMSPKDPRKAIAPPVMGSTGRSSISYSWCRCLWRSKLETPLAAKIWLQIWLTWRCPWRKLILFEEEYPQRGYSAGTLYPSRSTLQTSLEKLSISSASSR